MAKIRPFKALRPKEEYAADIAALPYDVYNKREAKKVTKANPLSFLNIDRPETQFPDEQDMYSKEVYLKADEMLKQMEQKGYFIQDDKPCYYAYELTMDGRSQTGIVACSSVDDYDSGVIKKHENTLKEKEEDRVRHVDTLSAQSGPIFLAYRHDQMLKEILAQVKKSEPIYAFTAADKITHRAWMISDGQMIDSITKQFEKIPNTYIADGHHRAASAVRVSKMRREKYPNYTGEEEFNFFLSVLFSDDELMIMDYNRVIKDVYKMSDDEILSGIRSAYTILDEDKTALKPQEKGQVACCFAGRWYLLCEKDGKTISDPVEGMEVSYLQREVLNPVFGIKDLKTDDRIDFVGGIRGFSELERRCDNGCRCAFAMYPTSIEELFEVADANKLMPPKSTWFEPKLRSGLFIHKIER